MEQNKRSVILLVSWIIGLAYAVYLVSYFSGSIAGASDAAEAIGTGIATALVMPHMIVVALAVLFNILGWACRLRWSALTGAILYAVAMVLFPLYALFVLVEMILSFVGFAKMKKRDLPAAK